MKAVAAPGLMRRHSNEPMAGSGLLRDFVGKPYGISATSLHLLLMQRQ